MNARERFLSIMNFESIDRTLKWEFGYWVGTIRRWYNEGLEKKTGIGKDFSDGEGVLGEVLASIEDKDLFDTEVHQYFKLDSNSNQLPLSIYPPFQKRILEVDDKYMIWIDEYGIKKKERKDRQGMPDFLEWPVKNRKDFGEIKEQWESVSLKERLPKEWPSIVEGYKLRTSPLAIGGYPVGLFGTLRHLMGLETLLYTLHDDPGLIRDMLNFYTNYLISLWGSVLKQVSVDYIQIWEDMCYRCGPLISPEMFKEFLLPYYKKIAGFCKDMRIDIIIVDCDGNVTKLLPLWIEGGVTGLYPFEVQSGLDIIKIRKDFPKFQIIGGIDKIAIAKGKKYIDGEIEKVRRVLPKGGYIPCFDHLVPPDVSWKNFEYYRNQLNKIIENTPIL